MKCHDFQNLILTDYVDGGLEKTLAERVRQHVAGCGECAEVLRSVQTTETILKSTVPTPVPSENVWSAIEARVTAQPSNLLERWFEQAGEWLHDLLASRQRLAYAATFATVTIFCVAVLPLAFHGAEKNNGEVAMWLVTSLDDNDTVDTEASWLSYDEDFI